MKKKKGEKERNSLPRYSTGGIPERLLGFLFRKECLVSRFSIPPLGYGTRRNDDPFPPLRRIPFLVDPFPEEELEEEKGCAVRKEPRPLLKEGRERGCCNPAGSRGEYRFTDY